MWQLRYIIAGHDQLIETGNRETIIKHLIVYKGNINYRLGKLYIKKK